MANRWGNQFTHSLIKDVWNIYAKCTFAGSGAVTLVQGSPAASPGVVSVTKESAAGKYTFVFGTQAGMLDVWPRLLHASVVFDSGDTVAASPVLYIVSNATATAGTCSMTIQCADLAGADTNPASGEVGYFKFTFSNSTAS